MGWNIPGFYEWTDSDQSRPSPLLWKVPLWSAILSLVFSLLLPWLPIVTRRSDDVPREPLRFSIRTLLILTAGVAVAIPLSIQLPSVGSVMVCLGVFAYSIWFWIRRPQHRMATVTLLACMMLPYIWILGYGERDRILPAFVWMAGGMPAFVPVALISKMIGQHFQESQGIAGLLTAFEFAIGIWAIRLGPKRTIAYLLLVIQLSTLGSLVFYQLCIA